MALIDELMSAAGLTRPQAEGALGALARLARQRLPAAHADELERLVPGAAGWAASAPKPSGMAAMLGDKAAIASVLSQLGIGLGSAGPIAQAVMAFIQANGSAPLREALGKLVR
jgi:hypothetical protein